MAPIADASTADASDEAASDVVVVDVTDPRDLGGPGDVAPTGDVQPASDVAPTSDVPPASDAPAPRDVVTSLDAVSPADAPVSVDVPRPLDAATTPDVVTRPDVPTTTDVVTRPDVLTPPDAGCAATTTLSFATPTPDEEIETCSASESPVFYTFTARASGPVTGLHIDLRTPDGALAPPPSPTFATAPYSFRRQVGGRMVDVPPLAVFGIRGTWHAEATATDACGRTVRASQAFTLIYTTRRCPNP